MKIILFIISCVAFCQAGDYDYGEVIQDSLLFYEAERSGKLPDDQKVTWRTDSALDDQGENGEDLTGGYYDAGNYVKFGFPMAFTTTVLSWGIISHEAGYTKADSLDEARAAVKWATDYFLKCHVSEHELYGQVGDLTLDSATWSRPEDMVTDRPAFKIDEDNPGSDLAGETAAALAATSIVFKTVNATYSETLLTHAQQLFEFADNFRGNYSDAMNESYTSSGYQDELVWGALWLYKATENETYLDKAQELYDEFQLKYFGYWFGWDQKISAIEVLFAQLTNDTAHTTKVTDYCDYMLNEEVRTPKGLVYINEWGPLSLAANAALVCLEAASAGLNPDEYREFAKSQIDYMLGDAGRSFVVGYGEDPPTHANHRSSDCPDAPDVCDWTTYASTDPNAHVLTGALIGGPDENDTYVDDREDYQKNAVATNYNAGFQSALAALYEL
uniref:cellulase n=1 Tax=Diploptera punctata TaxID=6984 RepID=A0A5A4M4X1_DIPPU|nr:beta-1,4-endoglucanase [Diploptera punctata]